MNLKYNNILFIFTLIVFLLSFLPYTYAEPLGRYGFNSNDNISNIADYIIEETNKLTNSDTNIFLSGEYINYFLQFDDFEKDYKDISIYNKLKSNENLSDAIKKAKNIKVRYKHDPFVFDNPVNIHNKSKTSWTTIENINDPYMIDRAESNMRGEWTLELQAEDDTKNSTYDKYSDIKSYTFIIHEKPNAVIEHWQEESDTTIYVTGENSFDLDFEYSKPNKGIVKYTWQYQLEDGSWHNVSSNDKRISLSKNISGQKVTNYSLTVEDCYGATDTAVAAIEHPPLMEPEPIILSPNSIYVGPLGSDALTVSSDSEPKSRITSYQYIFDFKSINEFLDITQNTVVNTFSYTFAKNTLKYNGSSIINRNATLKLTIDTGVIKQANKPINFVPIKITSLDMINTGMETVKLTASILNSNDANHKAIATVNGIDYDMTYKGYSEWQTDLNINGADKIYVRVINKDDSSIIYDKDDIVANKPPVVTVSAAPKVQYEYNNVEVSFRADDPEGQDLDIVVELKKGTGSYTTIWSKRNVSSGTENKIDLDTLTPGDYTVKVTARDTFNASAFATTTFKILPLRLEDLRITHIYNHPKYEDKYPILYNDPMVPVEYKTGYYITFKINAKGSPDTVKMKITYPGYNEEFDMVKEFENGSDSVWKLEWYSDPFTPKGTMINTEVKAFKDETEFNFNKKYGWDGDYLIITGTIEQDWRVDQDF